MALTSLFTSTETYDLTIQVDGVRNNNGYIMVGIYTEDSSFPETEPFRSVEAEAESGSTQIIIEDLPAGEYAIAIMHDENGNSEFDISNNGMPLEGWGFSNNPDTSMGPATWSDASFELSGNEDLSIDMMYLNY